MGKKPKYLVTTTINSQNHLIETIDGKKRLKFNKSPKCSFHAHFFVFFFLRFIYGFCFLSRVHDDIFCIARVVGDHSDIFLSLFVVFFSFLALFHCGDDDNDNDNGKANNTQLAPTSNHSN